ncbi:Cro/CI family transcriptional regulator [Pseudomonas oryzihabitans]|uniref:Cro/CI family transcriptional regulator n=1 Tax=Pseudomonas oryzihabitans TaxID=47885 RepID=UPI002899D823|nr:Cro/CI family transcriptional regulator [Pseudomonas oryzihabitans]
MTDLGVALKDFAKGKGQAEVARLIGVTQGSVSQMLNSDRDIRVRKLPCGSYQAFELKIVGKRSLSDKDESAAA